MVGQMISCMFGLCTTSFLQLELNLILNFTSKQIFLSCDPLKEKYSKTSVVQMISCMFDLWTHHFWKGVAGVGLTSLHSFVKVFNRMVELTCSIGFLLSAPVLG